MKNIIRLLESRNCNTIFPNTEFEKIISSSPDGIVLSPGPGDPNNLLDILENVRKLIDSNIPILGIARPSINKIIGRSIIKLPYGHRGGNHQ